MTTAGISMGFQFSHLEVYALKGTIHPTHIYSARSFAQNPIPFFTFCYIPPIYAI